MSIEKFQKQARNQIKKAKELKIKMSYQQALEIIAYQNGFEAWNALKANYDKKEKTVEQYWNNKGVDYKSISKLIDLFEEGHEVAETAKDLISLLDDYSFDQNKKTEPKINEDNFVYFDAQYFFSSKDSGSIYFKLDKKELEDFKKSDFAKKNYLDEEDSIIELAKQKNLIDDEFINNIIVVEEVEKKYYFGK